jgi:hypothetical protein
MGQFTRTSPSAGAGITAAYVDGELAKIETAHNTHATGDFPADCVPVTAVANDMADFCIVLQHNTAVGAAQTYATARTEGVGYTPMAFTLVAVTVIAGAVTVGAGNTGCKLYYDGAAASNEMALAAARTGLIDSAPVVTAFSAQKNLEIRVNNGAGDDASGITMILHCKKQHVS